MRLNEVSRMYHNKYLDNICSMDPAELMLESIFIDHYLIIVSGKLGKESIEVECYKKVQLYIH